MSAQKVAIVTGSNKGIGLAIVESLCKQLGTGWDVYLTARSEERGAAAVSELQAKGLQPKFHQLDVIDQQSISKLASHIQKHCAGINILVNNAGILLNNRRDLSFAQQVEQTISTNYTGLKSVCNSLFPLLQTSARVVHMSSAIGDMALQRCSPELRRRFADPQLTESDLDQLMAEFVKSAIDNDYKKLGWPRMAYGVSKLGVRLLPRLQAASVAKITSGVAINSCCPGYVATDMTQHKGYKSVQEGADTPLYLAMLPEAAEVKTGGHFVDRKLVPLPE